ncbi:hypothetical protein [Microbacterium sp. BF1]|nr:hypothetical protein [Microbacterium sp. BF1]
MAVERSEGLTVLLLAHHMCTYVQHGARIVAKPLGDLVHGDTCSDPL